jgi:hypothetical protein
MEPKMKLTVADKVTVPEVVLMPTSTVTVSTAFVNRNPSSWSISEENNIITAKNNDSSEVFVGTIEEFNIKLKG